MKTCPDQSLFFSLSFCVCALNATYSSKLARLFIISLHWVEEDAHHGSGGCSAE